MKNIIILFVFASLMFGADLEPTKPRTIDDIYNDLKTDIKTVEVGSDDYKILLGMVCNIEYYHYKELKNFNRGTFDHTYATKECNVYLNDERKAGKDMNVFIPAEIDWSSASFYPELSYGEEKQFPQYSLDIIQMMNGDYIFDYGESKEDWDDYRHTFALLDEKTIQEIEKNTLTFSEKFRDKYTRQTGRYIGEKISKDKALEILNRLADEPYLFDVRYAYDCNNTNECSYSDYFYNIQRMQNIYGSSFYISDKACLNLIVEKDLDAADKILSNRLKFTNGADFNSQECREIFDNDETKKLQKELDEKINRFSVSVYRHFEDGQVGIEFIDYLNGIVCDIDTYTPEEYQGWYTNEKLLKIFNNDDKENLFRKNYKTSIFELRDLFGNLVYEKGKYPTGIMFGDEELIVNTTEEGIMKLFEKPKKKTSDTYSYSPKFRCRSIGI